MATNMQSAKLLYAKDLDIYKTVKPYSILTHFEDGMTATNLEWETAESETIHDIRGRESDYSLDSHGFSFVKRSTKFVDWADRKAVEEFYFPETIRLIKGEVEDADEVEIFDWRRREARCSSHVPKLYTDMNNPTDALSPAAQVHLDQSPAGVLKRLRLLMGSRANLLLQGRVRVINVWRPIKPTENWPLALCDGSSMGYNDLIEVDLIRQDYIGSTMYAKYRPGFKWYYLRDQTPDEVCLFKNFDSDDVPATMCPHVSFAQSNSHADSQPRESIEVRAFVFSLPK